MKQVREALEMVVDTVSKSKGRIVVRRGFFYRHGMEAHKFADHVNRALIKAGCAERVVEFGEKYAAFRGGQTVAQGSHWWAVIA